MGISNSSSRRWHEKRNLPALGGPVRGRHAACDLDSDEPFLAVIFFSGGQGPKMDDHLVETWAIHNRTNLYLHDAISEESLGLALPKCRTVFDQFAHVHNVGLLWLKSAVPELLESLEKLEMEKGGTKALLCAALDASGQAIESLLRKPIAAGGKVKGFKPHATAFLGYLISLESHHRGQIGWTLKQSGYSLDQKTAFGLWEWGIR
jgi:uncharacterized damage-inducible protein DinB